MPPRMCPCETYVVSGASTLAPLAMGRFDRVGKHPHHVSPSTARPFDVFHNAEAGTYLFFWAPDLDWHIGTQVCSYEASSCPGLIASAAHDMNEGCPYATARRPWYAAGSQGQTVYVPLPDLTVTCPSPPASPPVPPAPPPPPAWPESAEYLNETERVAGIFGGALGSLLSFSLLLWCALCRPKRNVNPSRHGRAGVSGGGGDGESGWHELSISIATGVPVPQGRIATDAVMGVPVLAPPGATAPHGDTAPGDAIDATGAAAPGGVELARATPSSDALSLAEGQRLVAAGQPVHGPVPEAGRSRPEVGVPVEVSSGAMGTASGRASGRAVAACQSSVSAHVG